MKRILAILLTLVLLCTLPMGALAAGKKKKSDTAEATPAPRMTTTAVAEPPEEIRRVLDIAYGEWEALDGRTLKKCNKYTEWRGKGVKFEWCGGFVTWCMMQAGIEMVDPEDVVPGPITGVQHIRTANVGKMMTGYQDRQRATLIPQPGYLIIYGYTYHRYYHVGLIYDVEDLGGGKYRITTLEGNMSNTVRMYVHDYDSNAANYTGNLSVVPKDQRTQPEAKNFTYKLQNTSGTKWYANLFLMTWDPAEYGWDAGQAE